MDSEKPRNKIDAIYDLRDAVEAKARAEQELAASGSPSALDALLEAQLTVEAKTQDAIEACHECGERHAPEVGHGFDSAVLDRHDNVIHVDFRRDTEIA